MNILRATVLPLLLCTVLAQPSLAQDWGRGHGHDDRDPRQEYDNSPAGHEHDYLPVPVPHTPPQQYIVVAPEPAPEPVIVFDAQNRERIQTYLHEKYQKKCPPGLAKKGKKCTPPGQARYIVGGPLPEKYEPVPAYLYERLGPPPAGTQYVVVDSDVLLITEATHKILDAVTLLSAVK